MRPIAGTFLLLCALLPLDLAARADDGADAKAELSAAITLLRNNHMNSARVDWPAVEASTAAMLGDKTRPADAYPAIRYVITQLGEKHTFLIAADAMTATLTDKTVGNARPPDVIPPEGHELVGGIGLIALRAYEGSAGDSVIYATAARNALRNFARHNICRFIVDLRSNTGGNMYPMLNGLETLLGGEPYGYWLRGETENPWHGTNGMFRADADPPDATRQREQQGAAPVAILIDRDTRSSGEFTAMAFEGRPKTRFFGEPTGGYLTVNDSRRLPDGAMINISVGWAADRLHRAYRETIAPDENTQRGQATLDAAMAWLKNQPCPG